MTDADLVLGRLDPAAFWSGRLDLDLFVSETIGLDEVEKAFDRMTRGEVLRSVVVL